MSKQPKKMVMIPFEALNNLSAIQLQKPEYKDPNLRAMHNLETEMSDILSNEQLSSSTKLALYNQLFQRYNNIERQQHNTGEYIKPRTPPEEEPSLPTNVNYGLSHKRTVHNLLTYIPKNRRSRMRVLLDHLERNPLIDWDDKYEISVNGKALEGSNLVDIVTDLSKDKGSTLIEPIGIKEFAAALTNYNVPKTAILNPSRRHLFYSASSSTPATDDTKVSKGTPVPPRRSNRKHAKKLDWEFYNQ